MTPRQTLLHTDALTKERFYIQTPSHTHRRLYTQRLFHTPTFTHRRLYTQRRFYTQTLFHTGACTHRRIYTETLLHTDTLHTDAFTHSNFYAQMLLHPDAFTNRRFYTDAFTHRRFDTRTLAESASQYYFVLLSWHRRREGAREQPVLLRTTKLGQSFPVLLRQRKFRSQTSDNMNGWRKSQRGEEPKREDQRRERVRRKKMQVREKVGKLCVFPMICGSEWSKRRMKSCTPLWRKAHFQVKMYKTHQRRTTFGS